jgi:hypothetical protein
LVLLKNITIDEFHEIISRSVKMHWNQTQFYSIGLTIFLSEIFIFRYSIIICIISKILILILQYIGKEELAEALITFPELATIITIIAIVVLIIVQYIFPDLIPVFIKKDNFMTHSMKKSNMKL